MLFTTVDYEALNNKYYKALFENEDKEILRPISIRDDIITYNEEDFIQACKLKQRQYLENELQNLSVSLDIDVFAKMDTIRHKLNTLK